MIFESEGVLPVYDFLKTYIMMVRRKTDYLRLDDDDKDADFRYIYRDTLKAQFKRNLYNKNFNPQGSR